MPTFEHCTSIPDVTLVRLERHADERGSVAETYRDEWFPDRPPMVQSTRSDSRRGVLRGLHAHRHQSDYWHVTAGRLFAVVYDLRASSARRGATATFTLDGDEPTGVLIPPGVAHGYQALSDATLTYLVDRTYDPSDEFGVAWDDPAHGITWPISPPILSARDRDNPTTEQLGAFDA